MVPAYLSSTQYVKQQLTAAMGQKLAAMSNHSNVHPSFANAAAAAAITAMHNLETRLENLFRRHRRPFLLAVSLFLLLLNGLTFNSEDSGLRYTQSRNTRSINSGNNNGIFSALKPVSSPIQFRMCHRSTNYKIPRGPYDPNLPTYSQRIFVAPLVTWTDWRGSHNGNNYGNARSAVNEQRRLQRENDNGNLSQNEQYYEREQIENYANKQLNDVNNMNVYIIPNQEIIHLNQNINGNLNNQNDYKPPRKLLLLNGNVFWGNTGNRVNSLLHAYAFARDNQMEIGITKHSWAMDLLQSFGIEDEFFPSREYDHELWKDILHSEFGLQIMKNHTYMVQTYEEVHHMSAHDAYYYQTSPEDLKRLKKETGWDWNDAMEFHKEFLRRWFVRHSTGGGYIHSGLRSRAVCDLVYSLFGRPPESMGGEENHGGNNGGNLGNSLDHIKYTVIHSRYMEGKAGYRMRKLARTSKCDRLGAIHMSPEYVHSILENLILDGRGNIVQMDGQGGKNNNSNKNNNMLHQPIILFSDGQIPEIVEQNLLDDPIIGPNLIIFTKELLDGADIALSVLADVFIGNPASVTSGFIARSRIALGMEQNYLWRKKRKEDFGGSSWFSVCNDECIFKPKIMEGLI